MFNTASKLPIISKKGYAESGIEVAAKSPVAGMGHQDKSCLKIGMKILANHLMPA
ncbi:hypothetical protein [Desulfosarcina ovata]|uniref:hypothetical protein n=1 Tax=Desulfosarcina ovata TaxID=83564 RepID=UPI0012D2C2F4|nr:hypothetical protein [Desulfosarcina ovata]